MRKGSTAACYRSTCSREASLTLRRVCESSSVRQRLGSVQTPCRAHAARATYLRRQAGAYRCICTAHGYGTRASRLLPAVHSCGRVGMCSRGTLRDPASLAGWTSPRVSGPNEFRHQYLEERFQPGGSLLVAFPTRSRGCHVLRLSGRNSFPGVKIYPSSCGGGRRPSQTAPGRSRPNERMASQHGDARFRESSATDAMPGQRLCGRLARFVHPAESFHYHRRRQSLAGCFAQIQTDAAIGQLEIVKKITTDFGNRLEFVRNPNSTNLQRLSRKPHALNRARLLEFFLASFSTVDCSFQTQRLTGQGDRRPIQSSSRNYRAPKSRALFPSAHSP